MRTRVIARHTARLLALSSFVAAATVAQATAATSPPARTVKLVLSIGDEGQPKENALMGLVALAAGPDGTIWISEAWRGTGVLPQGRVRLFDSTGKSVRAIDGFVTANRLAVENGALVVTDYSDMHVSIFSVNGARVRGYSLSRDSLYMRALVLRGGVTLLVRQSPLPGPPDQNRRPMTTVMIQRPSSRQPDTLAEIWQDRAWNDAGRGGWVPTHFGIGGALAWSGDSVVALVDGYHGVVKWFRAQQSGLELTRTESLGPARRVTPEDIATAETWLRDNSVSVGSGAGRGGGPAVHLSRASEYWSIADQAMFAPDGALWVHAPVSQGEPHNWRVFPLTGPAFAVALPPEYRLDAFRGERLYGRFIVPGRQMVRVYEIVSQ